MGIDRIGLSHGKEMEDKMKESGVVRFTSIVACCVFGVLGSNIFARCIKSMSWFDTVFFVVMWLLCAWAINDIVRFIFWTRGRR